MKNFMMKLKSFLCVFVRRHDRLTESYQCPDRNRIFRMSVVRQHKRVRNNEETRTRSDMNFYGKFQSFHFYLLRARSNLRESNEACQRHQPWIGEQFRWKIDRDGKLVQIYILCESSIFVDESSQEFKFSQLSATRVFGEFSASILIFSLIARVKNFKSILHFSKEAANSFEENFENFTLVSYFRLKVSLKSSRKSGWRYVEIVLTVSRRESSPKLQRTSARSANSRVTAADRRIIEKLVQNNCTWV